MRINVFEGGRRIALALAILVSAFAIWLTAVSAPKPSLSYSIVSPRATPVRMDETCGLYSRSEWFSWVTPSGTDVYVRLCLRSSPFGTDGTELVPYRIDEKGMTWGASTYSDEVKDYAESIKESFSLPTSELKRIEREASQAHWEHVRENLGTLAMGLGIFWVLVWAVGWVVRGFAGIPAGRDERTPKSAD